MLNANTGAVMATPQKQGHIESHASKLHMLAKRLDNANAQVEHLLQRLFGPAPAPAEVTKAKEAEQPQGVLFVAEFAAESIQLEVDRLESLVAKLHEMA